MGERHNDRNSKPTLVGLLVGATGVLLVCSILWLVQQKAFHAAWLAALLVPWSVALGSLALMLIACLTGGRWAVAAWPWLTIQARMIPLLTLAFVPFFLGMSQLYPWADPDFFAQFENTQHRQWFYQPWFVGIRGLFYCGIWSGISLLVVGPFWKVGGTEALRMRGGQGVAGLSLVALALTATWAGIDWIMSFDPFFMSTLFGMLIGAGALLAGTSGAVAAVCFLKPLEAFRSDKKVMSYLSNLLLAMLMIWAYLSFAHFLIMWTGDLPDEAAFYQARNAGLWGWVTPVMSLTGFVLPFFCLLSRDFKCDPRKVGSLAIGLIGVRQVELWWMIFPDVQLDDWRALLWTVPPVTLAVLGLYAISIHWLLKRYNQRLVTEVDYVQ